MSEEFWDEKFGVDEFRYGTRPNAFIETQAPKLLEESARVLCLGAGEGRNAVWLAEQGYRVTAVDQSGVGLAKLDHLAAERGTSVETVKSAIEEWTPPAGGFDAAVMTFFHLPGQVRRKAHDKVIDALAAGGVVIMEAFTPRQRQLDRTSGGPPDIALMYTPELLRQDFAALSIEHLAEETVELDEGPGHRGPAEVVRLVARKSQGLGMPA